MFAAVYDLVLGQMEEGGLRRWRRELIAPLEGRVLEIGAGTGLNLCHYSEGVDELVLIEPDHQMLPGLRRRRGECDAKHLTLHHGTLDDFDPGDAPFDAIVLTLVLCTVPDPAALLHAARALLAPHGRLIFIEHVAASEGTGRRRWQHRLEPIWKRCAGNCHLTRETEAVLERAGFDILKIERESMRKAFPFLRPSIRGIAKSTAE